MILINGTQNTYLLDVKTKQGATIPVTLKPFSQMEDDNWLRLVDRYLPPGVTMRRAHAKKEEPKKVEKKATPPPPPAKPVEPPPPEEPPKEEEPPPVEPKDEESSPSPVEPEDAKNVLTKAELVDMNKPDLMKLSAKIKADPKGSKKSDYIKAILKKQKES